MRLIFAGTPEFARHALAALVSAGHEVCAVLTRPDRPAQRGQKSCASPVKVWAQQHGLLVWQPPSLRTPQAWVQLASWAPDVMVVAAYGLMLPPEVLAIPRAGCLNIHASLLPRWRGAAPIQRALQAGDSVTGITIMQMDAGLDTGPMGLIESCSIGPNDSAGAVHDRLAVLGGKAIVNAIAQLDAGRWSCIAQPAEGVSYAAKITALDQRVDWHARAQVIANHIRALDPAPGCVVSWTGVGGEPVRLKIWRAQPVALAHGAAPGTVLAITSEALRVACGEPGLGDALDIVELQRPGGRRMGAREFLAGCALRVGDSLSDAVPAPKRCV